MRLITIARVVSSSGEGVGEFLPSMLCQSTVLTERNGRKEKGEGGEVCERGRGGVGGGRDGELRRSSCWTGGRQGERERETEGGEVVTFSTSCSGGVVGVPLMPEGTYLRLPCQSAG